MKRGTIAVLLLTSSLCAAPTGGCGVTPPLGRKVLTEDVESETILSALYRLAHRNQICLGVVLTDKSLLQPLTRTHIECTSAGQIFRALVPRNYGIHQEGLVVVIRPFGPVPSWLSQRIPHFRLQRADTVRSTVFASLYMSYEMARDPHRKTGFAVDVHGVDFTNMIGPLDVRGKTVQELLNLIAERSRGATWVALDTPKWEFVEYQWPESHGAAQLRWISELVR